MKRQYSKYQNSDHMCLCRFCGQQALFITGLQVRYAMIAWSVVDSPLGIKTALRHSAVNSSLSIRYYFRIGVKKETPMVKWGISDKIRNTGNDPLKCFTATRSRLMVRLAPRLPGPWQGVLLATRPVIKQLRQEKQIRKHYAKFMIQFWRAWKPVMRSRMTEFSLE